MKALAIAFMAVGWTLVLVLVITLTGCVDEAKDWGNAQLDAADTIAQAAKRGEQICNRDGENCVFITHVPDAVPEYRVLALMPFKEVYAFDEKGFYYCDGDTSRHDLFMAPRKRLDDEAAAARAEQQRIADEARAEQQRKGEERERLEAANQRVRDAAPAMLEALQNLENDAGQIPEHAWKLCQDAIELATGERK